MAWFYNTGPIFCYVGAPETNVDANGPSLNGSLSPASVSVSPVFMGTCEQYPLVENSVKWNPVFNDIGGPMEPMEAEFQGQSQIISLDLNRFHESVISTFVDMDADGAEPKNARGKLMLANGQWFRLWLSFSFFGTPNQIPGNGLPRGEMYYACRLVDKFYDRLGTQVRKTRLVIEAQPVYYAPDLRFLTFSRTDASLAALPEPD